MESILIYPRMYNEEARKQMPTAQHIEETIQLFKDFGINIPELPYDLTIQLYSFRTYAELENWRRSVILEHLKKHI